MVIVRSFLMKEIRFFQRSICLSRYFYKCHYEVLELPRDCSQREIKSAFIKLSKKYHPDKNTDASTHSRFVKLNEAYTVLSRPETRREYDLSLIPPDFTVRRSRNIHYETDFSPEEPARPFRDSSFWENRDRTKDAENMARPYYGIKGIKKVSNSWVLTFLVLFITCGVGLQVYLINKSVAFSRKALEEESSRNADILREVRIRAQVGEGDSAVLERLQRNSDAQEAARKRVASRQD